MALREKAMRSLSGCMHLLPNGTYGVPLQQSRMIGSWVPEYFGKKSKYSPGTDFLGTPSDHLKRTKDRPLSPDVFTLDGKGLHYKLPMGAISSITNRVTGVGMSVGMFGAGYIALTGDLPGTIAYLKACGPLVMFPLKAMVAFPLVYHYLAGIRHFLWDYGRIPNQNDKTSMLELGAVKQSAES
eukprot:TRINITY_DN3350_c1_g1_i4.p1 TRINITY_DN3350_c1_g1~~TRINITY_DN3350_c1_g1_i4.p1  ORF type:complete len:184 (-),score=7.18 TRINITY_DN3350_c1_g1_i4:49-600(-)